MSSTFALFSKWLAGDTTGSKVTSPEIMYFRSIFCDISEQSEGLHVSCHWGHQEGWRFHLVLVAEASANLWRRKNRVLQQAEDVQKGNWDLFLPNLPASKQPITDFVAIYTRSLLSGRKRQVTFLFAPKDWAVVVPANGSYLGKDSVQPVALPSVVVVVPPPPHGKVWHLAISYNAILSNSNF